MAKRPKYPMFTLDVICEPYEGPSSPGNLLIFVLRFIWKFAWAVCFEEPECPFSLL